MTAFVPSRIDGRSDRRIVFELAREAEPDTLFDFETLEAALQEGVDGEIQRSRISRAVRQANHTLLRERRRFLVSVSGHGYRMIRSDEHLPVALGKKDRAERQIKEGIELLKNARLDELTEPQRTLHVGQLMILDGVYRMARASEKRHAKQEQILDAIRRQQDEIAERLAKLEEDAA